MFQTLTKQKNKYVCRQKTLREIRYGQRNFALFFILTQVILIILLFSLLKTEMNKKITNEKY